MMLNMLEQFPMAAFGHNSDDALHTLIEVEEARLRGPATTCRRSAVGERPNGGDALEGVRPVARRAR